MLVAASPEPAAGQTSIGEKMANSLIGWVPMLLLLVFWLILMRRGGPFEKQAQQVEELRRQTDVLERIAVALEKGAKSSHP
jgi:hypothetical protein